MRRKIDGITLTLFLILIAFIGSLAYLYDKNHNEQNFAHFHNQLEALKLHHKDFQNFLHLSLHFTNYDTVTTQVEDFNIILKDLETSSISEDFDSRLTNKLNTIRDTYEQERDLLEYQKSINAITINTMHYLFDLRTSIDLDTAIPAHEKKQVDTTLFLNMQLYSGIQGSEKHLINLIQGYKKHAKIYRSHNLNYFYAQSIIFIKHILELRHALKEHNDIALYATINDAMELLQASNDIKIQQRQVLNLLLVLGAIVLLSILIYLHRRALITQRELTAFRIAIEHSDNAIVMTDPDYHITYVNESFEKNTGYSKFEVLGENPKILQSGLTQKDVYENMKAALDRGDSWNGEFVNKRKDGSIFYESASIIPIFIKDQLDSILAIKLDITSYILQKEHMRLSATVFDNIEEGIIVTDADQNILSVNRAFTSMLGYSTQECIGQTPKLFQSTHTNPHFYKNMWAEIETSGGWQGKIEDKAKDGSLVMTWLSISVVRDETGKISHYISIHTNLSDIIQTQERIDFLAYHDALTELPNRIFFEESLTHSLKQAKRNNTQVAILFIDLDRFKVINDTLGHHVGDTLLKEVAVRIQETIRDVDMLSRIGGDEFIVTLENIKDTHDLSHIGTKILDTLAEPIKIHGHNLNISASIGIARFPHDAHDVVTLLKYADSAMYQAKELGKNRLHFFTDKLSSEMDYRLQVEQELRKALNTDELYLNYQPQYVLSTREVISAEALIRWNNKILGQVPPDRFIPIAEDIGLIGEVGNFVFEQSCAFLHRISKTGGHIKRIAINVSTQQFQQKEIVETFLSIVHSYDLMPSQIEIEITERYIMECTTDNLSILDNLRLHGFKISIDDFGTGYSSMSYLKKLPIDTIKIDKSFVDDLPHDSNDIEISKAIIALSNSLGYHTVAEGIETQEQEDFLRENGCEIGQGYLFSRPLDETHFLALLQTHENKQ